MDLDIGLCLLNDNPFNRNKSCIKFYEYAMVGTFAVAPDLLPYSEEPVYRPIERLDSLLSYHQDLLDEKAKWQRKWVLENRNIRKNWKLWEKVYLSL